MALKLADPRYPTSVMYCQEEAASTPTPVAISARPRSRGTCGRISRNPGTSISWRRWKNCTIVKPKPISEIAVRIHAMNVRSIASRVRIQAKWLLTLGSAGKRAADILNLAAPAAPNENKKNIRIGQSDHWLLVQRRI